MSQALEKPYSSYLVCLYISESTTFCCHHIDFGLRSRSPRLFKKIQHKEFNIRIFSNAVTATLFKFVPVVGLIESSLSMLMSMTLNTGQGYSLVSYVKNDGCAAWKCINGRWLKRRCGNSAWWAMIVCENYWPWRKVRVTTNWKASSTQKL